MQIALIADDNKKELMTQFCIAYCGILAKHELCATGTTGKMISEATGLRVEKLMAGTVGGSEQVIGRIEYDEIDMLLYFRNTTVLDGKIRGSVVDEQMLLMCDKKNVPLATNIATAEALIMALDRGDLAWREIVNPRYSGKR